MECRTHEIQVWWECTRRT